MKPPYQIIFEPTLPDQEVGFSEHVHVGYLPESASIDWLPALPQNTFTQTQWAYLEHQHEPDLLHRVGVHHLSRLKIIFSGGHECRICERTFTAHSLAATCGQLKIQALSNPTSDGAPSEDLTAGSQASVAIQGDENHFVLVPFQVRLMSKQLLDLWVNAVADLPSHFNLPALIRYTRFLNHRERTWGLVCPHCGEPASGVFDGLNAYQRSPRGKHHAQNHFSIPAGGHPDIEAQGAFVGQLRITRPGPSRPFPDRPT